jgi:hypothetical protein
VRVFIDFLVEHFRQPAGMAGEGAP